MRREAVGPGWSSPIVVDQRVFTQEQRGGSEAVVCRDAESGAGIWVHADPVRFEESLSGAGPRATPTFADGSLFTLGATGILNRLDAGTGRAIWSRDIKAGSNVQPPMWGFASSPLVTDGLAIVYAGGEKGLLAFRTDTGEPAWSVVAGTQTYTSAQLATLDGQRQVLFLSDAGLIGVDPATGRQLWSLAANAPGAARHPAARHFRFAGPHFLRNGPGHRPNRSLPPRRRLGSPPHLGLARLKPSFDDYVIDGGYAYGFDGAVFCCMDLQAGKRRWREGRFDHGQVVLLADQHLLLVISEEGEAILLRAAPEGNQELGRFKAVQGKLWSHPAIGAAVYTFEAIRSLRALN